MSDIDFSLEEKSIEQAIQKHRTGTLTIHTRPGAVVKVKQLQHEFWFGTCVARRNFSARTNPEDRTKYFKILKENFNSAVHENALKWYNTEKERGKVFYGGADNILDWCQKNDIKMRGHCIFWEKEEFVQDWLKKLDNKALRSKMEERARDVLTRYKGRISEYDVNNEMIHGDFYLKRFGGSIHVDMFKWCQEADPTAKLYVNDYEILTGEDFPKYEKHIEELLKAGAPIGGIGLQGHFLNTEIVDTNKIKNILDRLARFNLPVKITEFDIKTLNETAKAEGLKNLYKVCFAHPSVEGILMWGFWQNSHWLSSKKYGIDGYTAMWKAGWMPTPAAEVYRDLVFNKWWTNWEGNSDKKGICNLKAFYGKHAIEINGEKNTIELKKEEGEKTVTVRMRD